VTGQIAKAFFDMLGKATGQVGPSCTFSFEPALQTPKLDFAVCYLLKINGIFGDFRQNILFGVD